MRRRPRHAAALVALGVVLAAAVTADAGTIYSQGLDANKYGAYSNSGSGHQVVADQFTLSTAGTVTGIEWYGYYTSALATSITSLDFDIEFFSNSSGLPGTSLGSENVTVSFTTESSGGSTSSTDVYKFVASVSSLSLSAGTQYWLAIAENDSGTSSSGGTQWLWSRSAMSGTYATTADGGSSWSAASPADFAFTLTGSVVPLPPAASAGLVLLAGLGLLSWRRRRRASL